MAPATIFIIIQKQARNSPSPDRHDEIDENLAKHIIKELA
jgi:hypothetical protein